MTIEPYQKNYRNEGLSEIKGENFVVISCVCDVALGYGRLSDALAGNF